MHKTLLIILMAVSTLPAMAQLKGSVSDGELVDTAKFADGTSAPVAKSEQATNAERDAVAPQESSVSQQIQAPVSDAQIEEIRSVALPPEFTEMLARLGEIAARRNHKKLSSSADDSLSCLGMETVSMSLNGPGVVEYVDPHSDLAEKVTPGDWVLSIDGAPVVLYALRRENYGNSGTKAQVLVRHQNGVTEQIACERHPMKYFSSFVQGGLLPY
jgi:C-terminal processing protease CtpA/Prc